MTNFLNTSQMNFHYRTHGDKEGLPMLLLHGSYATSRWWEPFFSLLPNEIYAVAPDLRGCGQSEKTERGYGIEEQAADIWAFVQALGWERFDLVAHSSGGAIAVEFILEHPESAETLTLIDSVPMEGIYTPQDTFHLLEQMKTDQPLLREAIALLMPAFASGISEAGEGSENRLFFKQLVDDAQQMAPAAFTAIAAALGHWNRFAEVKYLTLPTLLLWGDQDTIVSRDAMTRTLIAIPGANNLEVLHGVGHSPMIEAPLALAERIVDFLTDDFEAFEEIRQNV